MMKNMILLGTIALLAVSCAKQPEPVQQVEPIEPEPVYDGKLG